MDFNFGNFFGNFGNFFGGNQQNQQNQPNPPLRQDPPQQQPQPNPFDNFANIFGTPFFQQPPPQNFQNSHQSQPRHRPSQNQRNNAHRTQQQQPRSNNGFNPFGNMFSNGFPFSNVFQPGTFGGGNQDEMEQEQKIVENPTSKNAINELPRLKYSAERMKQMKYSKLEGDCTICLDEFELNEDTLVLLPCQHFFHEGCIIPWIRKHNTCPICRFELPVDDPRAEKERMLRMIRLFTYEGMKIMELGMMVEKLFTQVEEGLKKKALEKLRILKTANGKLMDLMIRLDSFENFKTLRIRDRRKDLILKIQAIQKIIDEKLKRITKL